MYLECPKYCESNHIFTNVLESSVPSYFDDSIKKIGAQSYTPYANVNRYHCLATVRFLQQDKDNKNKRKLINIKFEAGTTRLDKKETRDSRLVEDRKG